MNIVLVRKSICEKNGTAISGKRPIVWGFH